MGDQAELKIRLATESDLDEVVALCGEALGWSEGDANQEFFLWKHGSNPFGPSPIWVAESEAPGSGRIVGVRAMMRWELRGPGSNEHRLSMVRAVDTATSPSHQGQGIFTRLTVKAVTDLTDENVDAVFNTPNEQSRPGYLKMGWQQLGRVPVGVQPRSPGALLRMVRSRTAAEKWGIPTSVGLDPAEAFADADAVAEACAAVGPAGGWHTPLSIDYLRWRTSFAPLACRVALLGASVQDGFVVFRLRNRGSLVQLSVLHVVRSPDGPPLGPALRRLLRETGADVAMATGGGVGLRSSAMVTLKPIGPILTWRPLANPLVPHLDDLDIDLGSTELF